MRWSCCRTPRCQKDRDAWAQSVVFLPGALRITHVIATLGTALVPGGMFAQATRTRENSST
jgi:hypothetical protein